MSPIMDHPIFCNLAKLFHSISNKPKSAEDILRQAGADLNKITDLLNGMQEKMGTNTNSELQMLFTYYQRYNQRYLELIEDYGMMIPPLQPGEDISQMPLPVRDPTRKRNAFRKRAREDSKNLYFNVQKLGVSTENASNKMKVIPLKEALVSPPPLISNDSSGSSSSGGSSA
ncbi:hypothetical protein BDQ12DRAFT_713165, partial [Crucibulum laeve]